MQSTESARTVTIDHIEAFRLTEAEAAIYANEIYSLDYLAEGLRFLNEQVEMIEDQVRRASNGCLFMFPNVSTTRVPEGLLSSMFHWYAVSACNYIRLAGWVGHRGDALLALDYLKRVAPELKVWRDKVAAHFARVKPSKTDTPEDLLMSVFVPIAWIRDSFWTQPVTFTTTQISTPRTDMHWSLTDTHKALTDRYWRAVPERGEN